MEQYLDFAYYYDKLTYDVEYKKIAEFIKRIFDKYAKNDVSLVCDLACGTGSICNLMSDFGYDMIGIDFSPNMLDVAAEKKGERNILYLNQDISNFELYGTVDAFLCLLDSVNHLNNEKDFDRMFCLANNYLNPEGLFVFDVNSPYKFKNILADNVFTYDSDDIYYVWENELDEKNGICTFYLTFFVNENGLYRRFDEVHTERIYTDEKIRKTAEKSGFEVVGMFGGNYDFAVPEKDSGRIFYVLKKVKNVKI
ncbi:MAG: class I SAM-dependent methyltransferase [Oscillospiraceae bacterium]|nr:class I SAM-dependent methyltransferase [Oscillospiraceae bacterium]